MTVALAWAWMLKNWRWVVVAAATALVIGVWAYASHWRHVAQASKPKLQAAVQQAKVQVAATKAVDHVATVITKTEEHTHVVVRTIQAAPGADTPVPPAVLASWRDGLRDDGEDPAH